MNQPMIISTALEHGIFVMMFVHDDLQTYKIIMQTEPPNIFYKIDGGTNNLMRMCVETIEIHSLNRKRKNLHDVMIRIVLVYCHNMKYFHHKYGIASCSEWCHN